MKRTLNILLLLACATILYAQEINCNVTINSDQIQGSNKSVFNTLQQSITDFMNNTKWTNLSVQEFERIECNMSIIVQSVESDLFTCQMTIQARRPVFNTSYNTIILNYQDRNFNFKYQEFDRLDYQESNITSNLAAMLAYYAYLIIGIDMDSYIKLGGTISFQQCENIVSAAQTASLEGGESTGWKAFDSNKNRYAVIHNYTDEAFRAFREYFYEYHRYGLDEMQANVVNGRARIATGLGVLKEANRARPATYMVGMFLDAKSDELINIFSNGTADEKKNVLTILSDVDPTRLDKYEEALNGD